MFGKKKRVQELKVKEAGLQQRLREAELFADVQSELVAKELRTPLVKLQRELQSALGQDASSEDLKKTLQHALAEVSEYKKVIDDIFLITRANLYKEPGLFVPINIAEATAEVAHLFQEAAKKKGIQLFQDLEANLTYPAHPTYFRKMVSLLIDNAIKYTQKGSIKVSLKRLKNEIVLVIEDTGVGMEPEQVSKAFKRFYRLEKSRQESVSGHGLGLSLAQWIARLHGTDLEVTSMTDKGTTLVVRFSLKSLM